MFQSPSGDSLIESSDNCFDSEEAVNVFQSPSGDSLIESVSASSRGDNRSKRQN